ncbi:MAG: peptidoglycan bridge formation glycyltransferase FemA/FemB family protein [Armatimonadetes bacterium]|jgi:lipid II:glycine glycyltransferase (peptidoglycan interpeptide bridge formation enzyme)|nr:peptidoglycan bridge formation glycyltransferase FemA/FemB family protein [Armatimonadota bacterium]
MDIRIATENDRQRFNDFIARFDTGDLLQSYEWGDLKAHGGWTPIRVLAEQDGEIVAAVSLLKRKLPKTRRCIIYAPRGPVLDTQNLPLLADFVAFLKQTAMSEGAILLKIDPPAPVEDTVSADNLISVGFKEISAFGFGGTQPKCVMQLDLDKPIDEVMASFKEKWRYNIRLADRKGVTVNIDCTKDDLPVFYGLLKETASRDGFLVRNLKYFEDMWDILVPAGFMRLVLTYYQDKPIAGAIAYLFGDKAMYTYGASSNEHRNVMPNHLMQWRMIQWAKESGCKWYDFRGVSPKKQPAENDPLAGLNRFKEGFCPRFVEYIGEYDMVLSPFYYWLWSVAKPWVSKVLKARGRAQSQAGDGGE